MKINLEQNKLRVIYNNEFIVSGKVENVSPGVLRIFASVPARAECFFKNDLHTEPISIRIFEKTIDTLCDVEFECPLTIDFKEIAEFLLMKLTILADNSNQSTQVKINTLISK